MLRLFGKGRFLDADVEDWCLETWGWLLANMAGLEHLRSRPFVLATRDFFPPTETEGHERALYVFARVKELMGVADWPCELVAVERPDRLQRVSMYNRVYHQGGALGTFRIKDGEVTISYAADLVETPRKLIAVLAHELAHYRLAAVMKPIPGGQELHELATELTVAFAGFGVFNANAAFSFEQHQDVFSSGWSINGAGYFSEPTWAFAIALFATLKDETPPLEHLKPSVAVLTRKAMRYLKRNPQLLAPLMELR